MPGASRRRRASFGVVGFAAALAFASFTAGCSASPVTTPTAVSLPAASPTASPPASLAPAPSPSATATPASTSTAQPHSLAGVVVALDPGHQLGNATHPREIGKRVWVGFWKECNTTGAATNAGYPEATFTWDVARRTKTALEALGARVVMTRDANSRSLWGPCVDERGRFGSAQKAALKVSIHGDGAPASGRGFHVIEPALLRGYTDDIVVSSKQLGSAMKQGLIDGGIMPSTYVRGAVSVRKDLGTLTMSNIPTVMVELGNMRNSQDAALMTSPAGRQKYAEALVRGIQLSWAS